MLARGAYAWAALLAALTAPLFSPQESAKLDSAKQDNPAAAFREQYASEKDPVRRAKLLQRTGAAEMAVCRKAVEEKDLPRSVILLGDYRDAVLETQKQLEGLGVDAENRPAGFKQLQISVRESLRMMKDILLEVPEDWKDPFNAVHAQLEEVNRELLRDLFPRQPGHARKTGKPGS
ncbi:MAG: hypothetical protein ACRD50_09245 [Candidatus Acidiferrales bacterium]